MRREPSWKERYGMNIECTCMSDSVSTEILMLVLGAVLGLLASLFTMIIQRFLDKKG